MLKPGSNFVTVLLVCRTDPATANGPVPATTKFPLPKTLNAEPKEPAVCAKVFSPPMLLAELANP